MDKVAGLIEVLFDNTAREDERDDAAMYLGAFFDDDRALNALLQIASNPNENETVLDSCTESIAQILVKRNKSSLKILDKLPPIVKRDASAYIKAANPEWFKENGVRLDI